MTANATMQKRTSFVAGMRGTARPASCCAAFLGISMGTAVAVSIFVVLLGLGILLCLSLQGLLWACLLLGAVLVLVRINSIVSCRLSRRKFWV